MTINIRCLCGARLKTESTNVGKRMKCPKCRAEVLVRPQQAAPIGEKLPTEIVLNDVPFVSETKKESPSKSATPVVIPDGIDLAPLNSDEEVAESRRERARTASLLASAKATRANASSDGTGMVTRGKNSNRISVGEILMRVRGIAGHVRSDEHARPALLSIQKLLADEPRLSMLKTCIDELLAEAGRETQLQFCAFILPMIVEKLMGEYGD